MSRETTLIKNTILITIGKICTQMITFFLLPLYTTILSTEEYGIVDLLNTLVSLCIPIVTFQIEKAIFRYLIDYRDDELQIKKVISTALITTAIQSIAYICIFCIIAPFIHNNYKYFLLTNVIATIFFNIMLQIIRGLGDNKRYTIASCLNALITVLLNVLFIVGFRWGAYGMIAATLIGNVISSLYIFIAKRIFKYIQIKGYEKKLMKKMWKFSVPLIPNAISWWVFNSSDRIIVSSLLGIGQNGILSAAYKFSSLYIALYGIFDITWTESAALHIEDKDNNEFFSKIINTALKFFATICFGMIAVMPLIFSLLINEKFSEAYYQIPILLLASFFNVIVGLVSAVYIAKKDTKAIAKTSIMAATINLIVNLGLIHYIGLYAASISTLVAYASMAIHRWFDVKKYINIKMDREFLMLTIVIVPSLFVFYYINNIYINIVMIIIIIVYAWIMNRKSIKLILNFAKEKLKIGAR